MIEGWGESPEVKQVFGRVGRLTGVKPLREGLPGRGLGPAGLCSKWASWGGMGGSGMKQVV